MKLGNINIVELKAKLQFLLWKRDNDRLYDIGLCRSWNPFRRPWKQLKESIGIGRNHCNDPVTIGLAVGNFFLAMGTSMGAAVFAGQAAAFLMGTLLPVVMIGSALWSVASNLLGKKGGKGQVDNGHLINSRNTNAPVRPIYGTYKVGSNWVFCAPSGANNSDINVVVTWGEGPVSGIAKAIENNPEYLTTGTGELSDLTAWGKYSGATYSLFQVKISEIGLTDKFAWKEQVNGTPNILLIPWSADIAITGDWQNLNNGVRIKFSSVTGHVIGTAFKYWQFYAGDGIWMGDHLYYYYKNYNKGSADLVDHTFYDGSSTQIVDVTLKGLCPTWNDAMRYTAYSIFKLDKNENAFSTIPEFHATLKGLEIHDVRDGAYPADTPAHSDNAALVALDVLTNHRYGFGLSTDLIDATSWQAIATWCDADQVTNGGSNYICIQDHTSAAGTEPGVGATWDDYWELGGSAGGAWALATDYESGYQFNGSLIDRQAFLDTFEDILLNFKAFICYSEGKYKLKTFTNDASVMALTDADVEIAPESFSIEIPGIPETPSKIKCAFSDPSIGYQTNWAFDEDSTLVTLGEDPKENEIALIGTSTFWQAQKLAKYYRIRNQKNKQFRILGHPRCYALEQGDMVTITHEFPNWSGTKLRISDIGLPQDGMIPITLMEEDSTIYVNPNPIIPPSPPAPPGPPGPAPGPLPNAPTLTMVSKGTELNDQGYWIAYIKISWTQTATTGFLYDFGYRTTQTTWAYPGGQDYTGLNLYTASMTLRGLVCGVEYKFRIREVNGSDLSYSEWSTELVVTMDYAPNSPGSTQRLIVHATGYSMAHIEFAEEFDEVVRDISYYYRWGGSPISDEEVLQLDTSTLTLKTLADGNLNPPACRSADTWLSIYAYNMYSITLNAAAVVIGINGQVLGSRIYKVSQVYSGTLVPPVNPNPPPAPIGNIITLLGGGSQVIDPCESVGSWIANMIAVTGAFAVNGNKITDGGMEDWVSATELTSWTIAETGTGSVDREGTIVADNLNYSAKLSVGATAGTAEVSQAFTMTASARHILMVRRKHTDTTSTLRVQLYDDATNVYLKSDGTWGAGAQTITLPNVQYFTVTVFPDISYPAYELYFTAHASYTNYVLKCWIEDVSGVAYLDGVYVKTVVAETTGANNATANDMTLMSATPQGEDFYVIMGLVPFKRFYIDVGTAGDGSWSNIVEYYSSSGWKSIPKGIGFSYLVSGATTYDLRSIPTDVASITIAGVTGYACRIKIYDYVSQVTQALGTRAYAEGVTISLETRPGFIRAGNAAIRVDVPVNANLLNTFVQTIDLAIFNYKPWLNVVSDTSYLYFCTLSTANAPSGPLLIHKWKKDGTSHKIMSIGTVNAYPMSLEITGTTLLILHRKHVTQTGAGSDYPQLTVIDTTTFEKPKTYTITDYYYNSASSAWYDNHTNKFTVQGDYVYIPLLDYYSGAYRTVIHAMNWKTGIYLEGVVAQQANTQNTMICVSNATHVYLINQGETVEKYSIGADYKLTYVGLLAIAHDTVQWATIGVSYIYIFCAFQTDRLTVADFSTVVEKAYADSYTMGQWGTTSYGTETYIPLYKSAADARIMKLNNADWSTSSTKTITGTSELSALTADATYIHALDYANAQFNHITVLISDFTTMVATASARPSLAASNKLRCFVKSTRDGNDFLALGFGEAAVSDNKTVVDYPITDLATQEGDGYGVKPIFVGGYLEVLYDLTAIAPASRDDVKYLGFQLLDVTKPYTFWVDPFEAIDTATHQIKTIDGYEDIMTERDMKRIEDHTIYNNSFYSKLNDSSLWTLAGVGTPSATWTTRDDPEYGTVLTTTASSADSTRIYRLKEPIIFSPDLIGTPNRTYTRLITGVKIKSLDNTNTRFAFGLSLTNDINIVTIPTSDSIFIYYGTADANFQLRTYQTAEELTDSGIAKDTSWHTLEILWEPLQFVKFYIDDVLLATHSTRIPVGSSLFWVLKIETGTTAARSLYATNAYAYYEET